jgi:hypothetical protein
MPSESDDLADFKKRHGAAWLAFGMARAPGLTTWNRNRVISGRGQFRGDDPGRTDGRAACAHAVWLVQDDRQSLSPLNGGVCYTYQRELSQVSHLRVGPTISGSNVVRWL